MDTLQQASFRSLTDAVGKFRLTDKTLLIPEMNRMGTHLLAAAFRGFGIQTVVMDTCKGLELGKKYTSGKECYPCLITLGDVLYFLMQEKKRLGNGFDGDNYVYFMPESDGPCRFGMYNKYQRIVLDSFPELRDVKITALTAEDAYSLEGLIEKRRVRDLRKAAYFSVVAADILDRLLWRIRPYERSPGTADGFGEEALRIMEDTFERFGAGNDLHRILTKLEEVVLRGKSLANLAVTPKPLIGIVGEIYLRTHRHANQDLIRLLERYGAECVNASIAEWVNYISYDGLRSARNDFRFSLKQLRFARLKECLMGMLHFGGDLLYKAHKQRQMYSRVKRLIDLPEDHDVARLEGILKKRDVFSFDVSTETCLSIAGIMKYVQDGYNGVVNVYPFTCMPSVTASAIVRPLMKQQSVPYLDMPYDSSIRPGNEAAIRTFMYQAGQHHRRHGRRL